MNKKKKKNNNNKQNKQNMSSYQDFIVNTLRNTASKTELDSNIKAIIEFVDDNDSELIVKSGKLKNLLESMGLTEAVTGDNVPEGAVKGKNISNLRSDLDKIVHFDPTDDSKMHSNGSGFLNNMQSALESIEGTLQGIQESIDTLTGRVEKLELPFLPVITLIGEYSITITQNSDFTDPGATAKDYMDNDLTGVIEIGGNFTDTSTPGDFTITYDVDDSEERSATQVTRNVTVVSN